MRGLAGNSVNEEASSTESIPQCEPQNIEGDTEDGSFIGDMKIAGNTSQTATVCRAAKGDCKCG